MCTRYIVVVKEPSMAGDLMHFNQSNAFDRVDQQYWATGLKLAGFERVFRGCTATIYRDFYPVIRSNIHLHYHAIGSPAIFLLYLLTLESLLRELEVSRGNL